MSSGRKVQASLTALPTGTFCAAWPGKAVPDTALQTNRKHNPMRIIAYLPIASLPPDVARTACRRPPSDAPCHLELSGSTVSPAVLRNSRRRASVTCQRAARLDSVLASLLPHLPQSFYE